MNCLLEVCCSDPGSVAAAKSGGADRIELCTSLETGGLTPSAALIDYAVRLMPGRVNVLIRPRGGDFLYSREELDVILSDIHDAVARGASGIVCGALTAGGDIDTDALSEMIAAAGDVPFTLHRAFDVCRDPELALRQCIDAGCARILTSGLAPTAVEGIPQLARLNTIADGKIILIAAAGVGPDNALRIVEETGGKELHASCKTLTGSKMRFRKESVNMGAPGRDEYLRPTTDPDTVSRMTQLLHPNTQP